MATNTEALVLRIPPGLKRKLKRLARQDRLPLSEWVRRALEVAAAK